MSGNKMLQIWEVELNLPTKWLAGGNLNIFSPQSLGEMIQFDWYVSNGLELPTIDDHLKIIYLAE